MHSSVLWKRVVVTVVGNEIVFMRSSVFTEYVDSIAAAVINKAPQGFSLLIISDKCAKLWMIKVKHGNRVWGRALQVLFSELRCAKKEKQTIITLTFT